MKVMIGSVFVDGQQRPRFDGGAIGGECVVLSGLWLVSSVILTHGIGKLLYFCMRNQNPRGSDPLLHP